MLKLLAEFDKNSKKECEAVKVRTVSSQLGQMDGFQWDRLTRSGSKAPQANLGSWALVIRSDVITADR